MSQAEDDAALEGDALADLVDVGLITDEIAFRALAGDAEARARVDKAWSTFESWEPQPEEET